MTSERFATHRDLVERYREHEASRGRVPPSFMWEELLWQLAIFVAGYLGEKGLDVLVKKGLEKWV